LYISFFSAELQGALFIPKVPKRKGLIKKLLS
jgi:hypothetical protein